MPVWLSLGRARLLVFAGWVIIAAGGCSSLSAGSSMQVEVEVYKGPLSKEPQGQLAELCGTIDELGRDLN